MIQQAYKSVSSSLWPCLAFFELKITNILELLGGDWNKVSCRGNKICISTSVFSIELLACQVSMVWLQIGQDSSIYLLEIILG